ncbi:MAG: site-specific integrase [Candidatus Acidiferrum sp.]
MREQTGYTFHRGTSWFVRFRDNVKQADGTFKYVQVCKKLDVEYGGEYRTRASVREFALKILRPINSGTLNPDSTQTVVEFVEKIYLPEYVEKHLRAATQRQYKEVWKRYLSPRMGKLALRDFRTVHGEQMLRKIAEQDKLGRSSLRHCKAFLSGAFKQAKRLGILDGINPIQDVSIPRVPEPEQDTYAYSLAEIKSMLAVLPEPARTVVLTAAFTGLRKSELFGLRWEDYDGQQLTVNRSRWNKFENEPKTRRSRSPVPLVKQLAVALDAHKRRAGILAQPSLPIFQAGNGQPLNLDNLSRRVITSALSPCVVCGKQEEEHKPEAHVFERDESLPLWHGWHAFRRGLATNLHALGVDGKTIQAILRHSTLALTMNIYVKSVSESQTTALDSLSEKFDLCNESATRRVQ